MRSLALIVILVGACSSPVPQDAPDVDLGTPTAPDAAPVSAPEFGDRTIPGRWLAGDFHVHATGASNDTGGDSTPERIKEVAVERGMDFIVLTDHSNSTGSDPTTRDEDPTLFNQGPEFTFWDKAAELSDGSFLMIDGNEISPVDDPAVEPTGHIGCYPRQLAGFNPNVAFIDRPRGEITSAQIVEQARDAGCFVTVNHPFVATFWIGFDWTTRDYDAIEVFNGSAGWDKFDHLGVVGWACDLSQGRSVTAVGGSDNHRVNIEPPGSASDPPLGFPTTWVWADALSWDGIIASLDAGRVSVSDTYDPLEIDVYDGERKWLGFAGSNVESDRVAFVRLRGALRNSNGQPRVAQIVRVKPGACNDLREVRKLTPPEVDMEVLFEEEIAADTPFDLHVEAQVQEGDVVFGWLRPASSEVINLHGAAVTNAVRFE